MIDEERPDRGTITTYVEPSRSFGWVAVAAESLDTPYFIPLRRSAWRLTKAGALRALPRVQWRLGRGMDSRAKGVEKDARQQARREYQDTPAEGQTGEPDA